MGEGGVRWFERVGDGQEGGGVEAEGGGTNDCDLGDERVALLHEG